MKRVSRKNLVFLGLLGILIIFLVIAVFITLTSSQIPEVSADELFCNWTYTEKRVKVYGVVSELGQLRGPMFYLDKKIVVYYSYPGRYVNVSHISNGDFVTATGIFYWPDHLYAESIEKVITTNLKD